MLELKNINKSYEIRKEQIQKVLRDLNVRFSSTGFVSILGSSGNGKTTLLNIIGGLDHKDSGEVYYNQEEVVDYDIFRRERVGFVFQDFNLINHLNAVDNVVVSMSDDRKNKQQEARKILAHLDLEDCYKKLPKQLSGGQKQRVAIARMIAKDVDIIVCDEPTGSLDEVTETKIVGLIKELSKEKLVLFVTHNRKIAEEYSDRIIKIQGGKVIEDSQNAESSTPFKDSADKTFNRNSGWLTFRNLLGRYRHTIKYIILTTFIMAVAATAIILQGEFFRKYMHENALDKGVMNAFFNLEEDSDYESILGQFQKLDHVMHATYSYNATIDVASSNYEQNRKSAQASIEDITHNPYIKDIIVAGRFPEKSDEIMVSVEGAIMLLKELGIGGQRLFDQYQTGEIDSDYVFTLVERRIFIIAEYGYPRAKIVGLLDDAKLYENFQKVYFIEGFTQLFEYPGKLAPNYIKLYKDNLYREVHDVVLEQAQSIDQVILNEYTFNEVTEAYNKIESFLDLSKVTLYLILVMASISFISLLLTSLFERKYEIGLYRSIGYNKKNIIKILGYEMAIIGIVSLLLVIIMLMVFGVVMVLELDYITDFIDVMTVFNVFGIVLSLLIIVSFLVLIIVYSGNKMILRKSIISNIKDI